VSTSQNDLDAWTRQRTFTLAFELADSGRHENFTDIAYALQFERGVTSAHAHALFDDPDLRRELNRRCALAGETSKPEPEATAQTRPQTTPQATQTTPSLLRRAAALWRSGTRAIKPVSAADLNSAAS
jgi:hypothetical protein